MREWLAGPQAAVLECRIQVKDGASARLGEVLTRAAILLRRSAGLFVLRSLDRVRVGTTVTESDAHGHPFSEATKIRGPASGPQPTGYLFMMRMKMRMWTWTSGRRLALSTNEGGRDAVLWE